MGEYVLFSGAAECDRKRGRTNGDDEGGGTVGTFDTVLDMMDLDEYLVDATDGMEREWDIVDQGAGLTSPIRNPYKRNPAWVGHHGGYELNKRKPPDRGEKASEATGK